MAFTPPPVESYIEEAQQPQRRVQFVPPPPESFQPDPEDFSRVPIPDVGALRVPGTVPLEQRVNQTPTRAEMQDGSLRELPPEGVVSKARRFLAPLVGAPNGEIMRGPAASDVDRRGFVRAILSPEKKTFPRLTGEDIATGNIKALLPGNLNEAGENPESFYNSTPGYEVPTWAKIAAGAQRAVAGTADVVANPMLTAGFAMTAGAPLLGRAASATFGVQMLKDLPDVTHSFNEAVKAGDVQGATEALVGGGLGTYFGVKAIQHAGRPGIAKESPMVRRLLSKQITETFTPEQLKDINIRVTNDDAELLGMKENNRPRDPRVPEATPAERELRNYILNSLGSLREVSKKTGVKVTQSEPAMESKFWRDYLGLEKGTKGISLLNKGEQNANRQQSSVPQTRSDQAESIQAIPERIPGEVQPVAGEGGRQAIEAPRPFTPPAPVEVSQSAPKLREFNPGPTMEFARQIADMTPEEYRVNAQSFNKYNIPLGQTATPAEVEELKQLREKVQKRLVDLGQRLSAKAKPTDAEIQDYNSLSVMPQFFNEAIVEAAKRPAIIEKSDEKRLPTNTVIDPAGGYPVQEADVDPTTLELSHDVPQFKEGAGAGGEVEGHELKGKYTRVGTGRTVVWERLNGNREIVTGRHKWQLALRNKLKDFPVQIVREADGFTRENALVLDAESNIRDNQGSVRDYAHYFRQTAKGPNSYTKEAAIQKGLLRDAKGRNGWDIGRNASDDLYSIWRAEKISDGQAVAIAKTVPGNPDIQALGIRKALEGLKPEELVGFLKSSIIETGGDPSQIDLFGNSDAALNRSVEIGKKAAARQREIYDEIRAVQGAAKNPTVAARHGVDVKDPEGVLKRIAELKAELEKWEHWEKHAELIAQLTAGEQKAKGVGSNGKENEKGKKQEVLKPKTGSPEKSGESGPRSEQINNAPVEHVKKFEELRNITIDFNNKKISRSKRDALVPRASELRKELGRLGYTPDQIYDVEMGHRGVPMPEKSGGQSEFPSYPQLKKGESKPLDAIKQHSKDVNDWKAAVKEWLNTKPENKAIVWQEADTEFGKGSVRALTRNIGNPDRPWRVTTYHFNNAGKLMPWGHQEYKTREEAIFEEGKSPGKFMEKLPGEVLTEQEIQGYKLMADIPDKSKLTWFKVPGGDIVRLKSQLRATAMMGNFVFDSFKDGNVAFVADGMPDNWAERFDLIPVEKQKAGGQSVYVPTAAELKNLRSKREKRLLDTSGKVATRKYFQFVDKMFAASDILDYRAAGPVVLKDGKAMLQLLANTDGPVDSWRVANEIDVTDQHLSPKPVEKPKPVSDVSNRLAMEDEANDWIKDVIVSKNAPKTADEAWISFRKNMGADTRGTAVVPKDYFVSSWDTFSANLAKEREARKAEKPKPAVRNLTKAEQNRFAVLAAKARDARDNAGEPLTGAELREYQDLEKIAGAQDLLVEPTSANDAAIEGEVKRLRAKAAELDRQAILTHNRANASNVWDVKNNLRKAAYDLDKEATAVRNKADELEATLKRKVGGNDLTLKADEPKPEKPAETVKEDDLFGAPDAKPIISDGHADALRKRIQDRIKKNQGDSGKQGSLPAKPVKVKKTDEQIADEQKQFSDSVQLGAYYITKGLYKFPEWSNQMRSDFGDSIAPQLKSIYETAKITIESPSGEGAKGRSPGLQPGLKPPTERIVTARSEFTKRADESIIPAEVAKHLDEHQRQGAASALVSMNSRGAFLLADGTGAGKTRQAIAVADYYAKLGKKVVIVTKAETIKPDWKKNTFGGSYAFDSKAMGIKVSIARDGVVSPGHIGITTYQNLAAVENASDSNTVLIFDESHALKNDSQQARHGMRAVAKADKVMFMSATPADKPEHIYYLAPIGVMEGKTVQQALRDLGMTLVTVKKWIKENGRMVQREITYWTEDQTVTDSERHLRFSSLFDRMTSNGSVLKREISMDGVHVQVLKLSLPPEAHEAMADILSFFDASSIEDLKGLRKAQVLGHQRRQQEPFKVASTVMLAKRELDAGRQVVIFVSRVNESEVGKWVTTDGPMGKDRFRQVLMSSEGTVKTLVEALREAGIHDIAEIHGNADQASLDAMADYQSGRKRVVVATIESGGTGINLDDTVGNRPRSMIVVTAPFDAVGNVQAAGRIWRLKTLSGSSVYYLFGDTEVDDWNADIIGTKMSMLGAVVEGQVRRLNMSDPDLVGTDDFHSSVATPEKKEVTASVGVPVLDWKPFKTKAGKDKFIAPATKEFWDWYNANGKGDNQLGLRPSKWQGEWQVWADTIPSAANQASLPNQITPVGQPQAPAVAKTLPELRALVNSPATGLSKEAVTLINAFLDSPLADTLDGLTVKIQDVVETGWDGSYFAGVVELARNADPKAGVHEFLHRAWEVLPQDIKAEFERMRVESLKDELLKTEDETRKQQIQDLIDNPTTGTADFLARGLPRDLYELSRAEELFTHSGSDQFKAKVGSIKDGFWARVKEFIKDFIAALKKAFKFKQSQEDWLRNILNGNFRIDPDAAGYARVGNAVITTRRGIVDMAGKASLTANHGTPHKVDKFTTDKMGTGEGAQAYGWGLYFAENKETADYYAKSLTERKNPWRLDGEPVTKQDHYYLASALDFARGRTVEQTIEALRKEAKQRETWEGDSGAPSIYANAANVLERYKNRITSEPPKVYTVTLNVEPDELLDWDKPLSEQPKILEILKREANAIRGADFFRPGVVTFEEQTGASFYERLVRAREGSRGTEMDGKRQASGLLENLGIKGIRYLDQGSRSFNPPFVRQNKLGYQVFWGNDVNAVGTFKTLKEAQDAVKQLDTRSYNYVIFNDADISITHENGKPVSVGEVVAGKQGSLPTSEVADNAERARAEAGLNLTDLEMPKDVTRLAEGQAREGVPTETFNIVNFVAGRQRLDESFRKAGQNFTSQVFAEIGIPVRSGPSDLFLMADPANPDPVAWTKMIDRLKKELAEQRVEGRADATGGLVNFLDSLILMWQTQRNAFEQMPPEIGRQLFQFAQGERSFRGLLLGAMAHLDNSVTFVGQNVDTMLQRVWSDQFNGAVVSKVMDRVLTEFKDFFTDEELKQIAADAPDLQQTVDEIIKRTRDANMADKVYQRASAWLKPKKPKGIRALQADARVKEAVEWILDAATKAGVAPTKPVSKKMTPQEQLLHLLTPGVAPKIQESIENAFTEMEWDAAMSVSKPDDRPAMMEAKIAGEQSDPELVAKGLALPKFAKWVATRDFVTNNLLGYNPVTLKLVQDLVTSDFSGTKFGKPVAKPAVTKIDLVALAKSPDAEVKRVLDAYLADIEANMQLKGAPPELRQRIKRMIYVQVRDQIAARREEFINSFISPKKSLPLSASLKLRQLINAGISKDTRFQNDKVRQLVKKIAGEYTKDVPFESLATSTRAEKQQWMERKADEIGVAEKFSQYDEDTRAQLEATVWTYLAERLQAAEEGITRQFLRGNDVKYDREQMTPEQRQASLDAAKSKIEGLVRAGAFDTSMVEAIGGKSSLAKLTPGLPELIKAALETPFYRQSELGEQFADKLVSEFSIDEAQRDKAKAAFNRAFGNKFKMARSKAADKAYESLTPQEKKAMPQRSPIWRKIERAVNADANFSTGETLRQIAKDNGWEVPSDEQIALVKDMSEQIQRLRELTAEESAAITDPALKAQAAVVKTAATQERRVALKRQIETYWARWTQPITLKSQMGRANAVSASYEFSAANLLFRLGFMTRQGLDVFTQIVQHIPTRSIGNAIVQHGGFWKNAGNAEFWRDAGSLLKQSIAQQIAAARPALREFREAMRGTAEAKNVDRLMSGIALFERMDQKAGELDAAGKHGQAFAMRFFGMVKFSYRFASALDNLQGVPQEWQEMRTQAFRTFRDNGMTTAEAKVATDTIIGDLKADHLRARALARQYLDATGRTPTKAELDAAAWHVVKALAYQRMRDAGMPADDFEERNRMMRSTNAWNEGIANVNSVGGVVANLAKRIGELGKSAAKAHPALMPIAAVAASFGRFGNAMGTAIDRSLTYTPIGLFPSAFGVNDQHIDPETGIAGKGSPWFRTREDRAQRKVEASMGTAWGTFVVAMVLGGLILVRNAWPKDKAKRDLWDRMGWKPGTVAFQLGDGQEIVASMTVGPMAMLRPYLAGAGALRDALDAKAEKQAQLNAEAEKLGLPPGEVKPLDLADMFSIAGNTMWASIMGGRTASGLVGSLTDYGTFNPSKTAAATVSPLLIGLPAVQEASRMAGVSLDSNLATFSDFLVPMPTSGARRVNLLGDPSGTPSDMQRIVQILTGGTYPGITSSEAAKSQAGYSALFHTGYRPPSINPNKAYAFDGAYRPMKDEELSKYTQLRGQYLKEELANLGDNPDERSARAAYQTANARALSEMGVQSQPRRAQPESQPASRSVPSPTSNASVSTPRFARVSAGRGRIAPIRKLRSPLRSSQRIRPLRPLKLKRQKYASVRRVRLPRFA